MLDRALTWLFGALLLATLGLFGLYVSTPAETADTPWWPALTGAAAAVVGLWRLGRSLGRWRPQRGNDAAAREAEFKLDMAARNPFDSLQ